VPAEIERKFLLPALPDAAVRARAVRIEQGYLAVSAEVEVRLRRAGGRMTLTAKRGRGESREEHEITLYKEQFEQLWALTAERRLLKSRRRVPLDGSDLSAEIDVYEGALAGLVVVEVEFDSVEQGRSFGPPEWFGEELTGERAYDNQSLAADGLPRHDSEANGNRGDVSRPYRLTHEEGVADGLRRIAQGRTERAGERLRTIDDRELAAAIHGARKDLKKLRAVLRLLRGQLGEKRFRRENKRYRDAGRLLSASRDAEVKIETLRQLEEWAENHFPTGASLAWSEALAADRDRIAAEDGDGAAKIAAARTAIAAGAEAISGWPLGDDSWRTLAPGIERGYRDGRKASKRARAEGSSENVHRFRKRTKDLWYDLRLLQDAWPGLLEPAAEEAHLLADLLGEHHDLAVLAEDLDDRAGLVASREDFRQLIERRQAELLERALGLGERLYAEKPARYRRRLHAYWRAWRG
jgi:CYTH domain-containing protein/CHAD domain-containing protein